MNTHAKKVFVGLSGGVDSSVAAARLQRAGYAVTGVFIKVWQPDFLVCNWEAERLDAMRVCATLDIPFLTCDATERYKADVVDYLIAEYNSGRTPNPDVMCNKHVKFGAFLDFADQHGADYIATGHYAQRIEHGDGTFQLARGADTTKDQSYFLWTLTQEQLSRTLFPIGDTHKSAVRAEATTYGLPTAEKPDSQGVCFLGQLDMKSFLQHFIASEPGKVLDTSGNCIGSHDGVRFYTIGQRHGFTITNTGKEVQPYYIIEKNLADNTLTVSHTKPTITEIAHSQIFLHSANWSSMPTEKQYTVQTRYRQAPIPATVAVTAETTATVTLTDHAEAVVSGQSCVVYDSNICLGGGIIK